MQTFFFLHRISIKNTTDGECEGHGATSQRLEAQEVSVEEYKDLTKRVDSIESSVEFVLTKV